MFDKSLVNQLRFLLVIFLIAGIYKPAINQNNEISIGNNILNLDKNFEIIAKVGDLEITAREFLINYEYGPAFLKRNKDSKTRYLNLMIYEKLLALDAYTHGFNDSSSVKQSIKEIEADLITEELYKEKILKNISVSEKEIEKAMILNNQHLTLQWLYTKEKDEIYNLQKLLREDALFDSLFYLQINDSVSLNDRSLKTTRFNLKIKNPDLSNIIDTLKTGKTSSPIKGGDGWYLFKIADGWKNVMLTETELAEKRKEFEQYIVMEKSGKLSDQYTNDLIMSHNPVIDKKSFEILMTYLCKDVLPKEKIVEWDSLKIFRNETIPITNFKIENYFYLPLVKYDEGNVSLKEFLNWYNLRKSYIKYNTSSIHSFFGSIQKLIWRELRDKLLTQLAYKDNLQNLDIVKIQKRWWKEKILCSAVKSNIAGSIKVTDKQSKEYYDKNKTEFLTNDKKQIPFEKAKDDVKSALYQKIYMEKILHRILKLKQEYQITVNEDILNNLKVDTENDPRAIDVYTVKKDGIIPHQAFPTIDYDWQTWY